MDRNQRNRTKKTHRPSPTEHRFYDQEAYGSAPRPGGRKMEQVVLPLGRATPPASPQRRAAARRRKITKGEKRRRRRRLKLITMLLVVLMVGAGALFGVNVLFKVAECRVENLDKTQPADTGIYSEEQILSALGVEQGAGIFSFSPQERAQAIGVALPQLETVEVFRSLPSTVIVRVEPARDTFCLETGSGWVVLSQNRKVLRLEGERPEGLILLEGLPVEEAQPGYPLRLTAPQKGEADPAQVLGEILEYMEEEGLTPKLTSIWMEDLSNISFLYDGRIRVELGTANSLKYKMDLAGYLLLNQNGDALSESDEGTLNCSHITQQGEIRPVFRPDMPTPEPTPEPSPTPEPAGG